ncbi:Crp/Fnr family transcriptional regulator [Emcibacter nanhaiensis]|uniref:Crp/Fnr family transcriptional regulator n=1 Tax=Emcibacter nanhaiensis TaxID=1505037 RepID=A0A501PFQ9_9PROT|nr:Crp/Fnr family transcriptional regulator [Emcibacter nanhaiensis]TPD59263.1 Crp/Fnr family transcriptional regulator [Emcibacter nanhaiensis]
MSFEAFVKSHGNHLQVSRNDHVFMQGDESDTLYYVQSGLLKAYYVSREGKEFIKSFFRTGDLLGSLSAVYRGLPCTFSVVALQDCDLITMSSSKLLEAVRKSPTLSQEMLDAMMQLAMKKEQREYQFLTLSAKARYKALCESDPELVRQVTQNDIAHYLGVTPVALSRIKKQLQL